MTITAETWSAIAATLSAIAAFLLWRTELRSFQHTARPEVVVTGWNRDSSATPDKITFSAVENIGTGSALYVHMNVFSIADDDRPMVIMSRVRESLVSPGNKVTVNGEITIWWKNVAGLRGLKTVPVNIKIHCWDTTGLRYLIKYNLIVIEPSENVFATDEIAPGVMLMTRSVEAESVWKLKLKQHLSQKPLIGRFFRE